MEAGSFHLQRVAAAFGGELRLFHLVAIEGQPPSASGRNGVIADRRRKTMNLGRAGGARAQPSALIAVFSFTLVPLGSPQLSPSIEANMRSKGDFYQ